MLALASIPLLLPALAAAMTISPNMTTTRFPTTTTIAASATTSVAANTTVPPPPFPTNFTYVGAKFLSPSENQDSAVSVQYNKTINRHEVVGDWYTMWQWPADRPKDHIFLEICNKDMCNYNRTYLAFMPSEEDRKKPEWKDWKENVYIASMGYILKDVTKLHQDFYLTPGDTFYLALYDNESGHRRAYSDPFTFQLSRTIEADRPKAPPSNNAEGARIATACIVMAALLATIAAF